MPFNVNEYNILLVGTWNEKFDYEMNGVRPESVSLALNLKFSEQWKNAAGKANRILSFMNRNFSLKNKDIILPLYVSSARPHLEYDAQF